ncbi:MAG: hypothetical protein ACKN9V_08980, partial [Pseudomonadota bacterium]
PFGTFWPLSAGPDDLLVWIASPEKLGPFLSCVLSQNFKRIRPQKIILLIEDTHEENIPFRELFEAKGVVVIPCVYQPLKWVDGFWGKVTELIKGENFRLDSQKTRFFISAEKPLLREVWTTLVHDRGVREENILHHGQGMNSSSYGEKLREKIVEQLKAA